MAYPPLVLLPITLKEEAGKVVEIKSADALFEQGEIDLAKWFKQADKWITEQNLNMRYLVIYTASAQDASVVDREKLDLEFIVESKAYWFASNNLDETHYLAGFLNSGTIEKNAILSDKPYDL